MSSISNDAGLARAIVGGDLAAIRTLRALLLEERGALTRREPEELNRVVQRKLECLQALQQNDAERSRLLAQRRAQDWGVLARALDPALAGPWEELRAALAEVAELTRINERIVARMRNSSERLLGLLRGQNAAASLYDRGGQPRACGDNRAITRA